MVKCFTIFWLLSESLSLSLQIEHWKIINDVRAWNSVHSARRNLCGVLLQQCWGSLQFQTIDHWYNMLLFTIQVFQYFAVRHIGSAILNAFLEWTKWPTANDLTVSLNKNCSGIWMSVNSNWLYAISQMDHCSRTVTRNTAVSMHCNRISRRTPTLRSRRASSFYWCRLILAITRRIARVSRVCTENCRTKLGRTRSMLSSS